MLFIIKCSISLKEQFFKFILTTPLGVSYNNEKKIKTIAVKNVLRIGRQKNFFSNAIQRALGLVACVLFLEGFFTDGDMERT